MVIVTEMLTRDELKQMADAGFGSLVKAVVDVNKELIAVDAELHADLEALLLENDSKQENLWGINLYPDKQGDDFIEFDSMINMRPSHGNMSRGVDDEAIQKRIIKIVAKKIQS